MKQNLFILFLFCSLFSCHKHSKRLDFNPIKTTIEGSIKDDSLRYKTGKFSYFNALTREIKDVIFEIDSSGKFTIAFDLSQAIFGSGTFEVEDQTYTAFYIEPGTKNKISFQKNTLNFEGVLKSINSEIKLFYKALNKKFHSQDSIANNIHKRHLSVENYVSFQKKLQKEKLAFLNNYQKGNALSTKAFSILKEDIRFQGASLLINYRYQYDNEGVITIRELPEQINSLLVKEYRIENSESIISRSTIDYISNFANVLMSRNQSVSDRISFYASFNFFSKNELNILSKIYHKEKGVFNTLQFKEFNTQKNLHFEHELSLQYDIDLLLRNIQNFPKTVGRDLIISQSIYKKLIRNNILISDRIWHQLEFLIFNSSILQRLKKESSNKPDTELHINSSVTKKITDTKEKYLNKYLGKVIFIDFYATWCVPCRMEIPYAIRIKKEFKNENVVFLNLCAKSKKENWVKLVKEKGIQGENYLLNNEEFNLLAQQFQVKGFPTYALVDINGEIVNYNAPRPSNTGELVAQIRNLLKQSTHEN